ncbi:hypothetical protein EX895_000468 [Sporisorium graminicola]|uniref:Uncharacterized protein n=1 Tax=Sporisorium graminicola TaxID=280036 RepID=A0A4U7L100_9BASI|nr:hypothetical protein EX895_000468 [Sporisorium graminicola]TKY90470.1 hypothetical protein EX895_000468 [Sporisorium graminicola]
MSFAAGPRSSSRGGNTLEFGGGVVPDDSSSHSDAGQSDSAASPMTTLYAANTKDNNQQHNLVSSTNAAPSSLSARPDRSARHDRLQSIDTLGSLEDFRSVIAFSSPSNLLEESPALTTSTAMSTPDFAIAVTANRDKPLPIPDTHESQPPLSTPSLAAASQEASSSSPVVNASSNSKSEQTAQQMVSAKADSSTSAANDSAGLGPLPKGSQRRSTAYSLPESISQPGSSQPPSEEFQSPGRKVSPARRVSTTEAIRRLEESVQRGTEGTPNFGLGISSAPEETQASSAYRSRARDSNRSSSFGSRRHAKSGSEVSAHSSEDSWGRTSFGRDTLQMLIDSDLLNESKKTASSVSSNTRKTYISDSDHSTTTAETSTDVNDSDHLSTIKEHTESPGSALQRRTSADSGLSRTQIADLSDACTSRTSASSARSDAFRGASPEIHFVRARGRLSNLAEAQGTSAADGQRSPALKTAVNGIGSPTFGFRPSRTPQPSAATELLPPVDLDASTLAAHARRPSNASWTYSRKPTSERTNTGGSRRGSADQVSTPTSRLASESYTTPLPSLPFPPSTPTSLSRPSFARPPTHESEPNTPNLAYEALLAKTVGKQKKGRPVALALNLATLSAFSNTSALSVNNLASKGLASPGKLRAPPPSAPPTDPLPPIPDTPSLAPKSPGLRFYAGSWASPASGPSAVVNDNPPWTPRTPRTPNISRATASNGHVRARTRSTGQAPDLSVKLIDAFGCQQVSSENGADKEGEVEPHAQTGSKDTVSAGGLGVLPPAVDGSSSPATTVSVQGSSDSATMVTVAQMATRAAKKPVRLSFSKKDPDVEEANKTAASTVVATEHADAQFVSPVTTSKNLKDMSQTDSVEVEPETPRSLTTLGQIISFDLAPQRQTFESSQQHSQQQQSRSTAANDKPSGPPPSAWNNRSNPLVSHRATASDSKASSDGGHEQQEEMRGGAESVASCHSTSSISNRRLEVMHDKEALLGALSESSRKEILKRTEGRFAGAFAEVAKAFRQLQADKLLLEQIVREKTPLSGLGTNNEMLSGYLSSMNSKLEHSNAEIRKLLDLLEQQREVMEQMMATHQLEKETYEEDLERLYSSLDETQADAEHHRAQVVRLNEELARAHAGTVQANAEAMRARTTLAEEGRKREKVVLLLRQAKERLREVETENLVSPGSQQSEIPTSESMAERLSAEDQLTATSSESEVFKLRRLLEERDQEIASLRLSHADAVMQQQHQQQDDPSSFNDSPALEDDSNTSTPSTTSTAVMGAAPSSTPELTRLREQILEQKEREKQIRTAYVYVREELRKVNSERRRSSISSVHSLSAPATTLSSSTVTPGAGLATATTAKANGPWATINMSRLTRFHDSSRPPMSAGLESDAGEGGGAQQVKLKRLSLPIVARASGLVVASPGAAPPSAYRPPST